MRAKLNALGIDTAFARRFFADKQRSGWTIRGKPVTNWVKAYQALLVHIKTRAKNKPQRGGDIDVLKMRAARLAERCSELYDQDRENTEKRRAELQKQIDAIDKEVARRKNVYAERTGKQKCSPDAMRAERAARRREREHEAEQSKPWVLWPNGEQRSNDIAKPKPQPQKSDAEHGYVLHGKFYTPHQANELELRSCDPKLCTRFRKAIRHADGRIEILTT